MIDRGVSELLSFALTAFMGFFAIMNPLANAPIFLGLTGNLSTGQRKKVAAQAVITAFFITATFAIAGESLFKLFGIELPAFKVTGGILVFLVGKHLLEGRSTSPVQTSKAVRSKAKAHSQLRDDSSDDDSNKIAQQAIPTNEAKTTPGDQVAISPLAIPILAGPGTLATAINYSAGQGAVKIGICISCYALLCFITFFVFIGGEKILDKFGPKAVEVISRLMGLILAVIGVQMIFTGLSDAFPKLF